MPVKTDVVLKVLWCRCDSLYYPRKLLKQRPLGTISHERIWCRSLVLTPPYPPDLFLPSDLHPLIPFLRFHSQLLNNFIPISCHHQDEAMICLLSRFAHCSKAWESRGSFRNLRELTTLPPCVGLTNMVHHKNGITVDLVRQADQEEYPECRYPVWKNAVTKSDTRTIRVILGDTFFPRITVSADFEWLRSNILAIRVKYHDPTEAS